MTSASNSIRSSYSIPSAFIAATASPRAACCCADSTCRGSSSVDSNTDTHVERVRLRLGVEQVECGERERRQRLVQREVHRQVRGEPHGAAGLVRDIEALDHSGGQQGAVGPDRVAHLVTVLRRGELWLSRMSARIAANASPGRAITFSTIAGVTRNCWLSASGCELIRPVMGVLRPGDEALRWLLADDAAPLLHVVAGLGQQARVLDLVLGRLDDDGAGRVESGPPGAARDLVELAHLQLPRPLPVVLAERGEHDRADRDVDADAESVGAADDLQQCGLGQLLDEAAVLRQHPGVVDADAMADEPRQHLAEAGVEPEIADGLRRSCRVSARVAMLMLVSDCACSSAAACVKWTT